MIDRIKFDGLKSRDWLIYKHPSEDLVLGTKLIVGEGQAAILVKKGKICDLFNAGTYTLSTSNIPLLRKIINIPFGGKTPFTAEVFYLNVTSKLDMNWGTVDPIQIVDPKYYVKLRVRAFGQIGVKPNDYSVFLRELIGVVNPADVVKYDKILDYFRGLLMQKLKSIIADIIINQKISALEITAKLDEISVEANKRVKPEFEKFGMTVVNFFIKSINFPDEDFDQINSILANKAEFEIMGDHRYVTKRSFDVYEEAASNESGVAGAFVAGGLGLGMGASMGANMAGTMNTNASLENKNMENKETVKEEVDKARVECPSCHRDNPSGTKFCGYCGKSIVPKKILCPKCGAKLEPELKFCSQCGTSLEQKLCECGKPVLPGTVFCPHCGREIL